MLVRFRPTLFNNLLVCRETRCLAKASVVIKSLAGTKLRFAFHSWQQRCSFRLPTKINKKLCKALLVSAVAVAAAMLVDPVSLLDTLRALYCNGGSTAAGYWIPTVACESLKASSSTLYAIPTVQLGGLLLGDRANCWRLARLGEGSRFWHFVAAHNMVLRAFSASLLVQRPLSARDPFGCAQPAPLAAAT